MESRKRRINSYMGGILSRTLLTFASKSCNMSLGDILNEKDFTE